MKYVAPSITVETEDQYKESVERLSPFATRVHVDISDGEFAPVFLLDPAKIWWPREWVVDIHVMMVHPENYVDALIALKPNLITFHAESEGDLIALVKKVKAHGIKAGLALLKTTVPETVRNVIELVDHVLIFSGDLGHYGGVASMMQLEKVRLVKGIKKELEIGWDGGVSVENAFTLANGGVDVLNIGGAIAKSENPQDVYAKLVEEANKQGVV